MSLPTWAEEINQARFKAATETTKRERLLVVALAIAVEAGLKMNCTCSIGPWTHAEFCHYRIAKEALRRIEELGK